MTERARALTRETFRSLGVRNFRLFFLGQLVSQVGNWLTLIGQTLLVLHLTDSGVAVGLLTAFQFVPVLLIGAWAGLVADRSDKRRLLLGVQVFAMVQSFVLAALAFTDSPPVAAIYAVAAFGGVAMAFDNPARRSLVVELVEADDVPNAVSLNSALMTSARVVGPALAGLLITTVGFGWCFALDGLSYVAVIAALVRMDPRRIRRGPVTDRGKGQVREGLRYVRRVPELWIPLAMMAIVGTLAFNFQVVMPLFVTRDLGGDASTFTWFFSVVSVGSLVGALATARRRSTGVRDVVVTSGAFGASMLVLAVTPHLALAFPVGVVIGVASIGFMVSSTAIVQLRADPVMRGRVLALQAIVFLGSTPIGGPILGWVSEAFGARVGVAVGGAAALAAAAFGAVAARRSRAAERSGPVPVLEPVA
ncbi:MAG: MFS transporter [Acidimicrobiia bacterium]|nr:MAG: MFS transporter [Acidimicrobiia bacterium]